MAEQGTPCQAGAIPSGCCLHSSSSPAPFSLTACSLLTENPAILSVTLFLSSTHPLLSTLPTSLSLHRSCATGSAPPQSYTIRRMPPRAWTGQCCAASHTCQPGRQEQAFVPRCTDKLRLEPAMILRAERRSIRPQVGNLAFCNSAFLRTVKYTLENKLVVENNTFPKFYN